MPKKSKGGKGQKRARNQVSAAKREIPLASDYGEDEALCRYAQVAKMLGNGRMEVMCSDNVKRMAHIPGHMHRKTRVAQGDIVLVAVREYQDAKCEIVVRYTPDEARELRDRKLIPDTMKINETSMDDDEDDVDVGVEFGDKADDDDDKDDVTLDDL